MSLTRVQRLILFSLGQFYHALNQPLVEKPLLLETSKITFIELLLNSKVISKQERAVYKNLETLEGKKLIEYDQKMIRFTEKGLKELQKITTEIVQYKKTEEFFHNVQPKRKLQTMIKS